MIEEMLYILRVACPWRDLSPHFGSWSSVYSRWRRWSRSGLWARLLKVVAAEPQGVLVHLDATHVKVHQDGTNPRGGLASQAIGPTRGGLNTKVTALVDSKGRALQLVVDSGNQADIRCADRIKIPSGHRLVAHKGYDSTALRDRICDAGSCPCIPNLKNRKKPARWYRGFYKLRYCVGDFLQRIKRLRRVGSRYKKLSLHFLGFVHLTAIFDWLKPSV
jgi:transposase